VKGGSRHVMRFVDAEGIRFSEWRASRGHAGAKTLGISQVCGAVLQHTTSGYPPRYLPPGSSVIRSYYNLLISSSVLLLVYQLLLTL